MILWFVEKRTIRELAAKCLHNISIQCGCSLCSIDLYFIRSNLPENAVSIEKQLEENTLVFTFYHRVRISMRRGWIDRGNFQGKLHSIMDKLRDR